MLSLIVYTTTNIIIADTTTIAAIGYMFFLSLTYFYLVPPTLIFFPL